MVNNKKIVKMYTGLSNFVKDSNIKKTWKNHVKGGNFLTSRKLLTNKEGLFGLGKNIIKNALVAFGYNKLIIKIESDVIVDYCSNFRYFFRKFVYLKSKESFNDSLKESLNMIYLYRTKLIMYNYKGIRLIKGLPVNGQRTRTNKKTSKKKTNLFFRGVYSSDTKIEKEKKK
jgi:hypothetical protein